MLGLCAMARGFEILMSDSNSTMTYAGHEWETFVQGVFAANLASSTTESINCLAKDDT